MLTTFDRYLFKRYLYTFVVLFISLFGLFVVIDGFTNVDEFQMGKESSADMLRWVAVYYGYQAIQFFDSREVRLRTDNFSAKHLSLTVLWAVYAIGIIGAGIARQSSRVRLAGMALLAIPVLKLFAFDVFLLERGFRVAAFITLGGLLLAVGLVYQRYSQAVRGFLFGQRA